MRNFTLATFYSPDASLELKLFYLGGDAAVRVTDQRSGAHLLDVKVEGGGDDLAVFHGAVDAAFEAHPKIRRNGTFYDRNGSCYFEEEYTSAHLGSAVDRALVAP